MKIVTICAICSLFRVCSISAQNLFGHVNPTEIIQSMPEYSKAQNDVNKLQEQYESDIKMMQEELRNKDIEYNKLPKDTPNNIRQQKEKEILDMEERIYQTNEDNQQALQKLAKEKMQAISAKVIEAIKAIGQEDGYIYIMDINKGIPYISTTFSTDVTAKVKTKLGLK
jgi:outer membrane protein